MLPMLPSESTAESTSNRAEHLSLPRIRVLVGPQPQSVSNGPAATALTSGSSEIKDTSSTDTDDDGELIQRAIKARDEMIKREAQLKQLPAKRRRLHAPRSQGVSLKTLIDLQLIAAGRDVLSLEYRGKIETADIDNDGKIDWKGTKFESPSAFSIYVKRLVNPSRKADDGWKTVKHNGRFLEYYKLELAKRRQIDSAVEHEVGSLAPGDVDDPVDSQPLESQRQAICSWLEPAL